MVEACPELGTRTIVTGSPGQVYAQCAHWVELMRDMIIGYDKGRGLRGIAALAEFLERREQCTAIAGDLGLV